VSVRFGLDFWGPLGVGAGWLVVVGAGRRLLG